MTSVVVVDLDSTLTDTRQRRDWCPTVNPASTWHEYWSRCPLDGPLPETIALVRLLDRAGHRIHIVSNRSARTLGQTKDWLRRHQVPYTELSMRPETVGIEGHRFKLAHLRQLQAEGSHVALVIDDDATLADALDALGVPLLCVNPRYATRPPAP